MPLEMLQQTLNENSKDAIEQLKEKLTSKLRQFAMEIQEEKMVSLEIEIGKFDFYFISF